MSKFDWAYTIMVALAWIVFAVALVVGIVGCVKAALIMMITTLLVMVPVDILYWFIFINND